MERTYRRKLIRSGNNMGFIIPKTLSRRANLEKGMPFQYEDEQGDVSLIPFKGTREEATKRQQEVGDVVFIQKLRSQKGYTQLRLSFPLWIYNAIGLGESDRVSIVWEYRGEKDILGRIQVDQKSHRTVEPMTD